MLKMSFIKNKRGQMAIFIALIFQVLFIFFAMAINIGLAVHDKINLQNATDLAAFYVAQKQAEMLNVIAHSNYQIRQAYKLLNFRYYYLGTLGYTDAPANSPQPLGEVAYSGIPAPPEPPVPLCIAYGPMWDVSPGDNLCKAHVYSVANVTIPPIIAYFLPSTLVFNSVALTMRDQLIGVCQKYAAFNWWYAATIYVAYDLEQSARKQIIHALANNMGLPIVPGPQGAMIDMDGNSIYEGAQKTFFKNLTYRNRISNPTLTIYNSLINKTYKDWLPDIDVYFTIPYQDIEGTTGACTHADSYVQYLPVGGLAQLQKYIPLPQGQLQQLQELVQATRGYQFGDTKRLSVGVEKNPWWLVYAGAKGTAQPNQLFSPFAGTTFTAKAFAQPFGGRIGPWYQQIWAPKANSSSGPNLEPMAPPRLDWLNNNPNVPISPGYSRFPGDLLGERSAAYLSSLNSLADNGAVSASVNDYSGIISSIAPAPPADSLAYKWLTPQVPSQIRNYEVAAIAPDLFDITYYSVQPGFGDRYLTRLQRIAPTLNLNGLVPGGILGRELLLTARFNPGALFRFVIKLPVRRKRGRPAPFTSRQLLFMSSTPLICSPVGWPTRIITTIHFRAPIIRLANAANPVARLLALSFNRDHRAIVQTKAGEWVIQ